jgi:hypothetical protein
MSYETLVNEDFEGVTRRLGGEDYIAESARKTSAFRRGRGIGNAQVLLRLMLAYCLGGKGLRLTAAWAASLGLADVSNVALLYRLRLCSDWFAQLVAKALSVACLEVAQGRIIRIVDGTTVPKAGRQAKQNNGLWRIHAAFDLPSERFSHFELTDEKEGERLDRIPVVKGEIRLADRAYLAADRIAYVLDGGGDIVIRAGWKRARWLDAESKPFDLIAALKKATLAGKIDIPVWLGRKGQPALGLRLVAIRKPEHVILAARYRTARYLSASPKPGARRGGPPSANAAKSRRRPFSPRSGSSSSLHLSRRLMPRTMCSPFTVYAGGSGPVPAKAGIAFKRLKSLIGLKEPPGFDERSAKPPAFAGAGSGFWPISFPFC